MGSRPAIRVAGFALFLFVDILSFHAATAFAGVPGFSNQLLGEYFAGLTLARIGAFATLGVALIGSRRTFLPRAATSLIATGGALLGTFLIAFSFCHPGQGALFVTGLALLGACQGAMGLVWLTTLASLSYRGSYLYLIGCHGAATGLCALTMLLPSFLLLPLAVAALGLANLCAALLPPEPPQAHPLKGRVEDVAPLLWRDILTVGVFAFVSGLVSALARSGADGVSPIDLQFSVLGISTAVLVVMAVPALAFRQPLKLEAAYRIALPLSALGFLVVPGLIDSVPPSLAGTLATTGYMLTGIVLYCTIVEIAKTARVPSLPLLAGSDCATLVCLLAGLVLGCAFAPRLAQAGTGVTLLALGCLYLLALGSSWIAGRHGAAPRGGVSPRRRVGRRAAEQGDAQHPWTGGAGAPLLKQPVPKAAQAPGATETDASSLLEELSDQGRAVLPLLLEGHTLRRIAEDLFLSQSAVKYHVQKMYRLFDVHTRAELASLLADALSVPDEGTDPCQPLAQEHDLTEREADILALFARGATIAEAAQQLSISDNTVKTHAKSLYGKLGVHSKQELIDLVSRRSARAGQVDTPDRMDAPRQTDVP